VWGSFFLFLAGAPGGEGLLHPRVGEQGVAELTQNGPGYGAVHIASPGNLGSRNLDLAAMPVGVLDGCSEDHPVESRPEGVAMHMGQGSQVE